MRSGPYRPLNSSAAALPGLSMFQKVGRGPVPPINFLDAGPQPGPSDFQRFMARSITFSKFYGPARPGPSLFQIFGAVRPNHHIFKILGPAHHHFQIVQARPGPDHRPMTIPELYTIIFHTCYITQNIMPDINLCAPRDDVVGSIETTAGEHSRSFSWFISVPPQDYRALKHR